jgi:hypothetical protein
MGLQSHVSTMQTRPDKAYRLLGYRFLSFRLKDESAARPYLEHIRVAFLQCEIRPAVLQGKPASLGHSFTVISDEIRVSLRRHLTARAES